MIFRSADKRNDNLQLGEENNTTSRARTFAQKD